MNNTIDQIKNRNRQLENENALLRENLKIRGIRNILPWIFIDQIRITKLCDDAVADYEKKHGVKL